MRWNMHRSHVVSAALLASLVLAACGSKDDAASGGACVAGMQQSCACASGISGTQSCGADGVLGVCDCSGAGSGNGGALATAGNGAANAGISGGSSQTGSAGDLAAAGSGGAGNGGSAGASGASGSDCGLGLAAPAKGFQVCDVGTTIQAGEETEYCEVVTLPGSPSDTYYVNRLETKMTQYSHHLIITSAEPGSSNEAAMTDGKRVKCVSGEQAFGQGLANVAGSQHETSDVQYPAGVGKVYHGGQKLSFDYHYLNVSNQPIMARAALNMHLVDKADVQHIARQFGFYNFSINTPVGQSASFSHGCTFKNDIMVWALTRHTHKWGTDFKVSWKGGANDGQELWTSHDWETDTSFSVPGAPLLMKAGTGFNYECDYTNTSDHALRFGTSATDEMCILFGTWWRVNESDNAGDQGCRKVL